MAPPFVNFEYILATHPKSVAKLNLANLEYLGFGDQGEVLGDKRYAYKVTRDPKEASLAKKLVGKRYKYLAKVYWVQKLRKVSIWVLKMERLQQRDITRISPSIEDHPHVASALRSLANLGYNYCDLHECNVMWHPKQKIFKLIDFGRMSPIY